MASKHTGLSSRCRSSKTRTTGSSIVARATPRRGTTVPSIETPGDASASNTLGASGETRSSAVATYVSKTIGSLSFSSTETQANGRCDREAHSASSVVFPQPGPADRRTTGIAPHSSSSKPISAVRGTVPSRPCGARSFDSNNSNAGAAVVNGREPARDASTVELTAPAMTSLAAEARAPAS